jgi:hypothetical protein
MLTNTAATLLDRIPIERLIIKEPDHTKDYEELKAILKDSNQPKSEPAPESEIVQPTSIIRKTHKPSGVSTQETVEYQNREIGKIVIQMERHAAQKFRINGKPCDCGIKHLPDIEELCEEAIPMVSDTAVYYKLIELGQELGPKVTVEAVESGQFDNEYPEYAKKYRDLRKELFGTLDFTPLFEKREKSHTLIGAVVNRELEPATDDTKETAMPENERKELLSRGIVT